MSTQDWKWVLRLRHAIIAEDTRVDTWSIDDIRGHDDTLGLDSNFTDEECRQILGAVFQYRDASVGINWDCIEYHIHDFLERRIERVGGSQ